MCGIAGIVGGNRGIDEAILNTMVDSFRYRGPDDSGTWVSEPGNIGLAQRRLSIIDPTPAGHQPMVDPETGNWIVFNGEVYNYVEIREELKKFGIAFNTGTDTEVILKAYRHWGKACLDHFNGMFAIAIWDVQNEELFMARDRLGIKPLYYINDEEFGFVFASEIKAIKLRVDRSWDVDASLIDHYMSFGYVPGEDALQKGIKRLLPGHCATLKNGELHIVKYWDLPFENEEDKGFEYYLEKSQELLESSMQLRLRSDVPLGIFLSGGIDSSAVVGMLSKRVEEPLKTFSVGYDFGKGFDEANYAQLVSKEFGTEHHEIKVDPKEFRGFIPKYIHLMDEPVTEAAAISLQFVSQLAADHVTVVLSGEGSDELFGGYDYYKYMAALERYRHIVGHSGAQTIAKFSPLARKIHPKIAKYMELSNSTLAQRYKGISSYDTSYKTKLYNDDYQSFLANRSSDKAQIFIDELFAKNKNKDPLSQMLYFDTKTWLVDDLLIKADRMSMASSLELRVPFLDYRLVELASSMPSKYKINKGETKYLLKKMMEPILPNEIIYRKKMGFPTPLKLMFRGELSGYVKELLCSSDTKIHEIFSSRNIEQIVNEHFQGKLDHHRALWQLVVLEEWFRENKVNITI